VILTPHFTYEELIASDFATRRGIDNKPPANVLPNLMRLAQLLEKVRMLVGVPIRVNSGYRSPALNRAVNGSTLSAHCDGRAADFVVPDYGTPRAVAERIARSDVPFDQLILEGEAWVHIGIARFEVQPRLQILTAQFNGGPATYTTGLG
jgi:zinc D-Ala-D-Ala carboxypeptidase